MRRPAQEGTFPTDCPMIDHHSWSTHSLNAAEVKPEWFVVDASGQTLGRLASRIAKVLQGKHKPGYTAHVDTGDFVVVLKIGRAHV